MKMNKPIKTNNLEEKIYLYVVLSQFNLGEHLYKFWLKHDTFSVKSFQLKMYKTYLKKCYLIAILCTILIYLRIKRIVMEKVGTVKRFAVGLIHCQNIFFAIEDLNLFKRPLYKCFLIFNLTSSAISGLLLTKSPCLEMETSVIVVVTSTASLLSVFRKMM